MEFKPFESWVSVDLYTKEGRLRSDDLAVRARAADLLAQAARALGDAAAAYQRLYVPPPTREQPFPPPEALEPARRAEEAARKLSGVADHIRNCPFPPSDQVWKRIRKVGPRRLFELDQMLIGQAEYAASLLSGTSPETLPYLDPTVLHQALGAMEGTLTERNAWLAAGS